MVIRRKAEQSNSYHSYEAGCNPKCYAGDSIMSGIPRFAPLTKLDISYTCNEISDTPFIIPHSALRPVLLGKKLTIINVHIASRKDNGEKAWIYEVTYALEDVITKSYIDERFIWKKLR